MSEMKNAVRIIYLISFISVRRADGIISVLPVCSVAKRSFMFCCRQCCAVLSRATTCSVIGLCCT